MKKYLIALDLDGTLLYDWHTLRDDTTAFIRQRAEAGHRFVIATGRPYRSSVHFYERLALDTPIINYNGALTTWRANPDFKPINIRLDKRSVIDIFTANIDDIENAFCEIEDDIYLLRPDDEIMPLLHHVGNSKLSVGAFSKTMPSGPNGCIVLPKKDRWPRIVKYVETRYKDHILLRNWGEAYDYLLELHTPKTNKGAALEYVARTLGFDRDDVIAFGDGHNDIEMLAYAGVGVAMKNAHPELLQVADVVSPYTNTEHAIERFLETYLK